MSKHTPGPWKAEKLDLTSGGKRWAVSRAIPARGGIDRLVAIVPDCSRAQQSHDAHLIAASPDLLKALEELCGEMHMNYMPDDELDTLTKREVRAMLNRAAKAIAKARGES